MALISVDELHVAYGGRSLLDGASLQIERGERIGLLGRNGEGKSTLLSVLGGDLPLDSGTVSVSAGVKIRALPQQIPTDLRGTVEDVVQSGRESRNEADHPVQRICSLLQLDPGQAFETLSGGQKRRTLLGRALVEEPDLLLLDEPTNHLDLDSIGWLEQFLARFSGSLLFVTHDRAFLQRLATRIIELDRGQLTSWNCGYEKYLERKAALLAGEEKQWAVFDKKLAQEEVWVRQGIKARRTRNEGRVRALEQLRRERAARRERSGSVRMTIQDASRSGNRVITAKRVHYTYPGCTVLQDFSTTITRGDRVGIIGPNGCGKTTLLNLLLGHLSPDQGTVKHGAALEPAYFDQHREQLDENRSVFDNLADGNDKVLVGGRSRHVISYLQDFLFSREQIMGAVSGLSGGERNRLLLARLFTRPSNLLVLDEPTNDLDTETLELLETRLLDYEGTVLVVSHDRTFLDNLCTSTLVFEGEGRVGGYVGGYSDWAAWVAGQARADSASVSKSPERTRQKPDRPRKLSNREREAWESLPGRIEELEQELAALQDYLADPATYRGDPDEIRRATERVHRIPEDIDVAFHQWAELDERA